MGNMLKRWARMFPKRWRKPAVWLNSFARVLRLVPLKTRVLVISGLFISGVLELFGLTMIIPLLATAAQVRTLLEHHAAAPELWRHPAERTETKLQKMRAGRTRTALKHQLQWMRVLQQQVALTPAQKKKLAAAKWVLVPLPKK